MPSGRIAVSTSPVTAELAAFACAHLERAGFSTARWPADGVGGRAMETAIRTEDYVGVLDLALTELAAELLGLPGGAGPERLTAAALRGIPQVIVPGGLESLPNPRSADRLAKEIAEKACASRGPTAIVLPKIDPDDAIRSAFAASLQVWIYGVEIVETEFALHDPEFAAVAAATLLTQLAERRP